MQGPPEPRDRQEAEDIYADWIENIEDMYPHIDDEDDEPHLERGYN